MHFADAFAATHREQPIRYAAEDHSHASFHAAMRSAGSRDRLPSLVYADWLDESGQTAHAEIVRRHVADAEQKDEAAFESLDFKGRRGGAGASLWHFPAGPHHVVSIGHIDHKAGVKTWHSVETTPEDAHRLVSQLEEEGVPDAARVRGYIENIYPHLSERPVQHQRDGDPLIRRKLNLKHQKSRAERNRKLTPAELAAKIRDLVAKSPRTLSKVQSALRLDATATAAAISEGERSGVLKTVPTARGRRVEPHSGPSPHTTSSAGDSMDTPISFAREFARHFAAYRAPEGGVSVKGVYYPGGQLVPDLTKFAAEPKVAEEIEMRPTGSYRGSQQFAPVSAAEEQVIRPRGPSYRGSQQLQLLPPRPNGLQLIEPATPKPEPRPLPSLSKRIAGSGSVGSELTRPMKSPPPRSAPQPKPKPKAKDDGVPIRNRTRESKRPLLDKLRRLIAKHLQPTRYSRGDHSHEAFHAAILNGDHSDRLPSLVYADWLEEQGQSAHAEIVRRHQQRAEELRSGAVFSYVADGGERHPQGQITAEAHPLSSGIGGRRRHVIGVGYNEKAAHDRPRRSLHYIETTPEDAHRLASQLEEEGVADADLARRHIERQYPHLRPQVA